MRMRDMDVEERRRLILEAAKSAGLDGTVRKMIEDGLLDSLSVKPERKEEEKIVAPSSIEIGDIYTAKYDFENIGATIYEGEVLVVVASGIASDEMDIGVARDIASAKAKSYIDRWSLEKPAILAHCTKYIDPKKETVTESSVRKEVPARRMNQEQFRVALSEH